MEKQRRYQQTWDDEYARARRSSGKESGRDAVKSAKVDLKAYRKGAYPSKAAAKLARGNQACIHKAL